MKFTKIPEASSVSISGTKKLGKTLTANLSPNVSTSGYSFTWYRTSLFGNIKVGSSKSLKVPLLGIYFVQVKTPSGKTIKSSKVTVLRIW